MLEWIKFEHLTLDKPEVISIAAMLKIDKDAVIGKLLRVWIWADKYTQDGRYTFPNGHAASKHIDDTTRCDGFATAMQHAGWLVISTDGQMMLPNYGRNNGQTAKKRVQTARRMSNSRNKNKRP